MKKIIAGLLCVAMVGTLCLSGCGKSKDSVELTTDAENIINKSNKITLVNNEGKVISDLNGQWVAKEINDSKPIAVMINNIAEAQPQSGIGQADIIYEVLVEGGITRLMAVFSDYSNLDRIGSVRSSRHYYVIIADEYDAIYTHVGQTYFAEDEINRRGIDTLNALSAVYDYTFYRDNNRVAPHNCYTSTDGILSGIDFKDIDIAHSNDYEKKFSFYSADTDISGEKANIIRFEYNSGRKPYMEYNATDKLYYRFQYGDKQIDESTNTQLSFKNVIVQYVNNWNISGEYLSLDLVGEGEGYYATNGMIVPITWKKTGDYGVTKYYNLDGTELKMNPGKTWISIFPETNKEGIVIE